MQMRVIREYNHLPQIAAELRGKASAIVRKTTFDISAQAKTSMGPPKHGHEYRRGGKVHVASAPGEPPAIDTGNLINSIQEDFPNEITGVVYTPVAYAPILEFGGAHIAPRPFFTPAAEAKWPEFLAAMQALVGR